VAGAFADSAIGNRVLLLVHACLGEVDLPQFLGGLKGSILVDRLAPGMLLAPGICPPRCAVSDMPGGAITLPVNSSGLRTSTRLTFPLLEASMASGKRARSSRFTWAAL
jgi:hypothetical protein